MNDLDKEILKLRFYKIREKIKSSKRLKEKLIPVKVIYDEIYFKGIDWLNKL